MFWTTEDIENIISDWWSICVCVQYGNLKTDHLGDLRLDRRLHIIILQTHDTSICGGLNWFRKGINSGLLWTWTRKFRFCKTG